MYLDNCAVRSLQKDLIPPAHRPLSVIGEWNVPVAQHRLESFYIIDAKRNMAPFNRVQALLFSESYPEVLLGDVKLRRPVGEEFDLITVP